MIRWRACDPLETTCANNAATSAAGSPKIWKIEGQRQVPPLVLIEAVGGEDEVELESDVTVYGEAPATELCVMVVDMIMPLRTR